MAGKPIIISFAGWSNSGKSSFIERLLPAFAGRGLRVSTVKKSRHQADLSPASKDSRRFALAGAEPSIYISENEMVITSQQSSAHWASRIPLLCEGADVILMEGFELPGALRVLVGGPALREEELKRPLGDTDILISAGRELRLLAERCGIRAFSPEDPEAFMEYVLHKEREHGT
jgi:molybdopterin-guanine dinucleotide biosynthesis protein B